MAYNVCAKKERSQVCSRFSLPVSWFDMSDKAAAAAAENQVDTTIANPDVVAKYKEAAAIANSTSQEQEGFLITKSRTHTQCVSLH